MTAVLIDAMVYKMILHPTQYLAAAGLILAGIQVVKLGQDGLPVKFESHKVAGDGRGKTLGFPTINLQIPWNLVMTEGIYAGWIWLNGEKFPGALHFGIVPTFNKFDRSLEVFVLTKKSLPNSLVKNARIQVEVIKKLREIKQFASSKDLVAQMTLDVAKTKRLLID
jgi:riboflavin kinase/FMN adenylyltransferase